MSPDREKDGFLCRFQHLSFQTCVFVLCFFELLLSQLSPLQQFFFAVKTSQLSGMHLPAAMVLPGRQATYFGQPLSEAPFRFQKIWPPNSRRFIQVASLILLKEKLLFAHLPSKHISSILFVALSLSLSLSLLLGSRVADESVVPFRAVLV